MNIWNHGVPLALFPFWLTIQPCTIADCVFGNYAFLLGGSEAKTNACSGGASNGRRRAVTRFAGCPLSLAGDFRFWSHFSKEMPRVSFFFFSSSSHCSANERYRVTKKKKKSRFVAFFACNDGFCRCKFGEEGNNFVSGKRLVDRNKAWKKRTIVHRRKKKQKKKR